MVTKPGGLALITGASSGIGYELAKLAAAHGYHLLIGANEPDIDAAAESLRSTDTDVVAVNADFYRPKKA